MASTSLLWRAASRPLGAVGVGRRFAVQPVAALSGVTGSGKGEGRSSARPQSGLTIRRRVLTYPAHPPASGRAVASFDAGRPVSQTNVRWVGDSNFFASDSRGRQITLSVCVRGATGRQPK